MTLPPGVTPRRTVANPRRRRLVGIGYLPRRNVVPTLIVLATVFVALSAAVARAGVPFDQKHFIAAIRDASVPQRSDVDAHLFELSDANQRLVWRPGSNRQQVKVAVVMTVPTYRNYYRSGSGTTPLSRPAVWATLAPQLQAWCRKFARRRARAAPRNGASSDLATRVRRRLVQRLGLSPRIPYKRVVELWVDRANVFRPCPDPGVADRRCQLQMQGTPQVKGIADYPSFFASLYVNSYGADGAPWTRLGYTYDWGGPDKFGASEYMLTTGTHYEVKSATTVYDYCR